MSMLSRVDKKQRTINGRNIQGEERIYTFHLMNSETAYKVFHQFANNEIPLAAPVIVDHLSDMYNTPSEGDDSQPGYVFDADDLPVKALHVVKFFPLILTWERITELNRLMLSNALMKSGEDVTQFNKDGFADINPLEMYNALLYAIVANYEPLIPPLLLALE